jgi:hypothetical protein
MNTSALTLMLLAEGIVTAFTVYFFYLVLTAKPRPEPDSFSENEDRS